jgi:hypothetical protein
VKLSTIAVFGAGYVLGSRAGRERYVQIVELAQRTAQRIEERQSARARSDGQHSSES